MASANLFLDKSRQNKEGLHPCTIRVTHQRKQWMVSLGVYATVKDYEKALSDKGVLNDRQKELRDQLMDKKIKAQDIIDTLATVTKDAFNKAFYSEVDIIRGKDMLPLRATMESMILELREEGRINTAEVFKHTLRTLLLYKPGRNLQDIDPAYLRGYEAWMQKNGSSLSTASIYLRCLKRVFNRCIKDKVLNKKYYPFEDHVCRSTRSTKTVLYPADIEKFLAFEPDSDATQRSRDFWLFSFLCNGLNPRDIFDLRKRDIQGERLTFLRHKTAKRYAEPEPIVLYLHPLAQEIIERQGGKGDHVFPLFDGLKTEQEKYAALHDWKRHTNRCLNRIAKRLELPQLNMGIARHSMATALAMKNIHISVISRMLGHTKIETTQHYLKGLPDEAIKEINHSMLDFTPKSQLKAV